MKGMALAHRYYDEVISDFLHRTVPDFKDKIAVGLVGEGSECFGFDDEWSRSHDWGAKVCLWLDKENYINIGTYLEKQLYALPDSFHGYPVCWIQGRNGVLETDAFFRKYLNTGGVPQTVGQWLSIPEAYLAVASNGEVFTDKSGRFSAIWHELRKGYPEDIRLKKLAARCMTIAQAGQYNYPRLVRRQDHVGAALALEEYIRAVISAVYLLNNRYTPFYKWMHHGMKQLPVLGISVGSLLEELLFTDQKQLIIEKICGMLIEEFHRQEISHADETFMTVQGEAIHQHIRLEGLRRSNPWVE